MPQSALEPIARLDPVEAWRPWVPDAKQPWNLKWAAHLYRRAAFGATPTELKTAVQKGLAATLQRLFDGDRPDLGNFEQLRADSGLQVKNEFELRSWWLNWMMYSTQPVREKLTLFWHNHFATSIVKVESVALMHRQNVLLYKHALGKFGPFLLEISRDPAMLIWLDSNNNVKGKPNENYAREVMELFSLGVGNYTEKDIREAARAFTGWHTEKNEFVFKRELHDEDVKTVLGQTGKLDGGDVVRVCLEQAAAPRFLVRKLYRYFISETQTPPDSFLQPLADRFKKSDYDIADLVKTMLQSRHFFSAYAYRQRLKSPVEYVLGAANALASNPIKEANGEKEFSRRPDSLIRPLEAMGQPLFAPPNVKGWEFGQSWLNTATVLARANFAQTIALGGEPNLESRDPTRAAAIALDPGGAVRREKITDPPRIVSFFVDLLLQGDINEAARAKLINFLAEGKLQGNALDQRMREAVHAIMNTPEYQLA